MITLIRDHFDNWPLLILTDACIHADQHRTVLSESLRHPLHDDYIDPWLLRHLTAAPSDRCLHIYADQYRTISRENLRHLLENKQSSVKTQRAWELFCDRWCELRCLVAPRLPPPLPVHASVLTLTGCATLSWPVTGCSLLRIAPLFTSIHTRD